VNLRPVTMLKWIVPADGNVDVPPARSSTLAQGATGWMAQLYVAEAGSVMPSPLRSGMRVDVALVSTP